MTQKRNRARLDGRASQEVLPIFDGLHTALETEMNGGLYKSIVVEAAIRFAAEVMSAGTPAQKRALAKHADVALSLYNRDRFAASSKGGNMKRENLAKGAEADITTDEGDRAST